MSLIKSISGIKQLNTENTTISDKRYSQAYAYNKMVDLIAEMDAFIVAKNNEVADTYPEYNPETIRKVNIFNF